ncbi:hypothetical protein [uncultured Selenomonas sp.]|uniref:hypothetical protein n=1 Tax=uncultured Selenomonas sp. TaxID=159275 RepID=UPI0025EC0C2C|nr:hypothetical protein [uncultured Selenomonas sp.]
MRKKLPLFIFFCTLVCLLCASVVFAAEKNNAQEKTEVQTASTPQTLRLARVPLIVRSSYADDEVENLLEDRLDRALHVPLNDTMHYVEELPASDVEAALDEVLADLKKEKRRVRMKDAMQLLAEKLDADLVVCPVLTDYREIIFYGGGGWDWDSVADSMILESRVGLELDGYDRTTQENFSEATSRFYHEGYAPRGRASVLAKDALESLIAETDINERVMRTVRERVK